jgi:hypothetical protein
VDPGVGETAKSKIKSQKSKMGNNSKTGSANSGGPRRLPIFDFCLLIFDF